jgi:hypothetical protein
MPNACHTGHRSAGIPLHIYFDICLAVLLGKIIMSDVIGPIQYLGFAWKGQIYEVFAWYKETKKNFICNINIGAPEETPKA